MDVTSTVEQTGGVSPSQTTEATPEVKPIQREEEAIGALFDKAEQKQQASETQDPPERKEEARIEPQISGQQALEAPAHWSEEDKAVFKTQPKEVQDFLLKRNKALESDYGRKTQQLADQRKQLEALSFLEQKMKYDETFRAHVMSYGNQQPQKDSSPKAHEDNTPPDDPIEQIIWEAEKRIEAKLAAKDEAARAQTHAERVQQTMQTAMSDPMFDQVQQGILGFINALPGPLRGDIYARLDSNPDAYMETFALVKQALSPRSGQPHNQQQPAATSSAKPQRKETVHKPLIEQGGASEEINTESRRFKDIRKKAAGGDLHAIGAMFDLKK